MLARSPGAWPGPAAEMLEQRREPPAFHGTVQLRLRKPSNAPPGQRIGGYGSVLRPGPMGLRRNKEVKNLACRKSTSESGGIQAPGACGPGLQGAWGPGPQGLGPGPPGAWGLFPTKLSNYDFFANLLVGAWRRRGCRLKRLLRRRGPGGKRSRDTPPTPPPPWGCKGERKRVRLRQPSNTPPKVGGP